MTKPFRNNHYDAIIIGARCAGAATGMLLARAGLRVLIADRAAEIGDTLSTHALMKPAVTLLHQWGLLDEIRRSTPAVNEVTFFYGDNAQTIPIKPVPGIPGLYAPRRYLLDRVLGNAARNAGADLVTGLACQDITRNEQGRVTGVVFSDRDGLTHNATADIVIGADGRASTVANLVGAKTRVLADRGAATAYIYLNGLINQGYRWYFDKDMAAGLIPTTDGGHCLFASCRHEEGPDHFGSNPLARIFKTLARWEPELAEAASTSQVTARPRKYPGCHGHLKDAFGDGWALVGDAGYFKDPATAHGITDAFLDANRLAQALTVPGQTLADFEAARDEHAAEFMRLTHEIAGHDGDLDRLAGLHMQISQIMKAEQAEAIAGPFAPALAA